MQISSFMHLIAYINLQIYFRFLWCRNLTWILLLSPRCFFRNLYSMVFNITRCACDLNRYNFQSTLKLKHGFCSGCGHVYFGNLFLDTLKIFWWHNHNIDRQVLFFLKLECKIINFKIFCIFSYQRHVFAYRIVSGKILHSEKHFWKIVIWKNSLKNISGYKKSFMNCYRFKRRWTK